MNYELFLRILSTKNLEQLHIKPQLELYNDHYTPRGYRADRLIYKYQVCVNNERGLGFAITFRTFLCVFPRELHFHEPVIINRSCAM